MVIRSKQTGGWENGRHSRWGGIIPSLLRWSLASVPRTFGRGTMSWCLRIKQRKAFSSSPGAAAIGSWEWRSKRWGSTLPSPHSLSPASLSLLLIAISPALVLHLPCLHLEFAWKLWFFFLEFLNETKWVRMAKNGTALNPGLFCSVLQVGHSLLWSP